MTFPCPVNASTDPLDPDQWQPIDPPLRFGPADRKPEHIVTVVTQSGVATSLRYRPFKLPNGRWRTWCNIAAWDWSRALGCEIPHWLRRTTPKTLPDGRTTMWDELDGIGIVDWLRNEGPKHGWRKVTEAEAVRRVNAGFPTFVVWRPVSPKGAGMAGHIAMFVPDKSGRTRIAQAGLGCFANGALTDGFLEWMVSQGELTFHTHD